MSQNIIYYGEFIAMSAIVALALWWSYQHITLINIKGDKETVLSNMTFLEANTRHLITDLCDYGVKYNAFHKQLLEGRTTIDCLNYLFDIRENLVTPLKFKYVTRLRSKKKVDVLSSEISERIEFNCKIENALFEAWESGDPYC